MMLFRALDVVRDDHLTKSEFLKINQYLEDSNEEEILAKVKKRKPSNKIESSFGPRQVAFPNASVSPELEDDEGSRTNLIKVNNSVHDKQESQE